MFISSEIEYKRVNLLRSNFERKYALLFRTLLNRQFKAVAAKITEGNYTEPPLSVIDDKDMEKLFISLYQTVGTQFATSTYRTRKARSDEELEDKWMQYMKEYATTKAGKRIVSITSMTKEQILRIIGAAVDRATEEGLGAAETARNIRKALKAEGEVINGWRALRIARTEVMTASNAGSLQGAKDLGMPMDKIWIATMDQRTRDTHLAMNNVSVDINEKFSNGMDGPGDPEGGAGEVINCRCTLTYRLRR